MVSLLRQVVFASALAGLIAGSVQTLIQHWQVIPLILQAETYEVETAPPNHQLEAAAPHDGDTSWTPQDGVERTLFTSLANIFIGIGFALVLSACFVLRGSIGWREGVLWGAAGFLAFSLAPALGLPPELPGAAAADLFARQTWWLATVTATAGGLALAAFGRSMPWRVVGALIILAPHIVGGPHPTGDAGAVPPELAAHFAVSSLFSSAVFWLLIGGTSGYFFQRFAERD